jgi:Peptidase A4 family
LKTRKARLVEVLVGLVLVGGGLAGCTPTKAPPPNPQPPILSLPTDTWAGYINSEGSSGVGFSAIKGTFTVPDLHVPFCSSDATPPTGKMSTWLGIGGINGSGTLLQAGTEEDLSPDGCATYGVWYELLPAGAVGVTIPNGVSPGDVINISIVETDLNHDWSITLTDTSRLGTVTANMPSSVNFPTLNALSAEAIVERVNGDAPPPPGPTLPDSSPTTFDNVQVSIGVPGSPPTWQSLIKLFESHQILYAAAIGNYPTPGAGDFPTGTATPSAPDIEPGGAASDGFTVADGTTPPDAPSS